MRTLIQRVKKASVKINGETHSKIGQGLLVFVGIENTDDDTDIEWLTKKILNLRIFNDETGAMNLSLKDVNGNVLVISQFTLHASTKKGNRPSYVRAAKPEIAVPLYEKLIAEFENKLGNKIGTGKFGADMKVELLNDGPVTILIDSKNRE